MLPPHKTLLAFSVLLAACSPGAWGQGTYTQIDYPAAIATSCMGINTAGDITGLYQDGLGTYHGFLLSGGLFTTIDYLGAQSSGLYRINDFGQIVGFADSFSFMYDEKKQTFAAIVYPGAADTIATSISNSGDIAGFFSPTSGYAQGFKLIGSSYRPLPPFKDTNVYVWGITTAGELVGTANRPGGIFDFYFAGGKYQQIAIPGSPHLYGVNKAGLAFVGDGFLYRDNNLHALKFPGGGLTYAYDINNAGEVVGLFLDSSDHQHGFTWVPSGRAGKNTPTETNGLGNSR